MFYSERNYKGKQGHFVLTGFRFLHDAGIILTVGNCSLLSKCDSNHRNFCKTPVPIFSEKEGEKNPSHFSRKYGVARNCFVVLVLLMICFRILLSTVLIFNSSESMPRGFYLRVPGNPAVGDYIVFKNPNTQIVPVPLLLKRITDEVDEGFIVSGDHPRSFDSRFYGAVDKKNVRRVVPLFIWE